MELCVLGSGTAAPSLRRGSAGYVVRTSAGLLLFDCGPGTMVRMLTCHVDFREIDRVFLTHHHADHCADLVALIFANNWTPGFHREHPLHLVGPRGTRVLLDRLFDTFSGLRPKAYEIVVEEWEQGEVRLGDCTVASGQVVHGDVAAIGYRVTEGGRTLVYSGDTGETPEIVGLAREAHTLLLECSFPDEVGAVDSHLTASGAGRVATQAGVERLVLTHFYPQCDEADIAGTCGRAFGGEIILAEDGMRLLV